MKRIFKFLAVLLAMVLVAGSVPASSVSAASTVSVKAPKKAIFVGGCTGTKASGKKASYKSTLKVKSLLTGFDADNMTLKLTSSDKKIASVSNKTYKVKAVAPGTATITVKVYKKTDKKTPIVTSSFEVTVKKNASDADLTYKGITNGATYTVGQKLTVQLPKGTDTDKRRLTSANANAEVKSAGTNKWTVTIAKEGAIELKAEAYMSSSYKGATASKTIKATAESEDKPLVIGVEQKSLKSFVITGLQEEIEKADIKFYTIIGKDIKSGMDAYINEVKYDEKTGEATVTTYTDSDLTGGTVYYVEVDGSTASFTAAKAELADVKKMELATTEVKVGTSTPLEFKYYNKDGIDITGKVKTLVNASNLTVEIVPSVDYAYVVGQDITVTTADQTVAVKATLTTGYDTNTYAPIYVYGTGAVKSYKDSITNTGNLYAVVPDDSIYMTKKDAQPALTVKIGDSSTLEALFAFSDGTFKTFNDTGYAISSTNPAVLMIGTKSSTGGYNLTPVNAGEAAILISEGPAFDANKVVATVPIKVLAARKASTFTVTQDKTTLNYNALVHDFLYLTATAYDQYGEKIDTATFTIEQDANSMVATGTVSPLAFVGNVCYIEGSYFTPSGKGGDHFTVNITCNEIANCVARPFSIYVKDVAPTDANTLWVPANTQMIVDGDKTIDTMLKNGMQTNDTTFVAAQFYVTNNGKQYFVSETLGTLLTAAPTSALTATTLGVTPDSPYLYYTISLNGKVINPADAAYSGLISTSSGGVEFKPFKMGAKLPKGTYTVTVYKLIPRTNGTAVIPLKTQEIQVIESTPDTSFTKVATETTGTLPGALSNCFKVYYEGTDVTSAITSGDYTAPDSNSGSVYVYSIKVGGLYSSAYGSFSVDIPVGELIKLK